MVLKQHDRERAKICRQIRTRISAEVDQIGGDHASIPVHARHRFLHECADLRVRRDKVRAALRERLNPHNAERRAAAFQKARWQAARIQADRGQYQRRWRNLEPF